VNDKEDFIAMRVKAAYTINTLFVVIGLLLAALVHFGFEMPVVAAIVLGLFSIPLFIPIPRD
jgi:hypothetical protein